MTHFARGQALYQAGRMGEAIAAFREALMAEPRNPHILNFLGTALRLVGQLEGARECFERTVALVPDNPDALNNLGLALHELGRFDAAFDCYARALAAKPGFAQALNNWGLGLRESGDLDGALAMYAKAIAAEPGFAEAFNNAGIASVEKGDLAGARAAFERAARLRPDFADPRFSLGLIALRQHDFVPGWEAHELRLAGARQGAVPRAFAIPRLQPGDLARVRRLAVWREGGLGDQILFATLLPELVAHGIRAVVEVDARLLPAFRRSLPQLEFTSTEESRRAFEGCDFEVPLGSLPRLFRPSVESFAAQPRALLAADGERVAAARTALGPGRWIGVSWRSFQKQGRRYLEAIKSMPLETLALLGEIEDVRLLDLQYGDAGEERAAFGARHPGTLRSLEGLDTYTDVEGMLAAIQACESIVTTSNVTAHLAGALGKRTRLVYLAAQPHFHYWAPGADGHSLWYPSVEIVTDASWTTWERAVEAVAARLAKD